MNVTNSSSSIFGQIQSMQRTSPPSAADITTKVFENSDSDSDGLLSLDELSIDEDTFNSMDSDGDGSISTSELQDSITSKLNDMKNNTSSPEDFGSFLSSLGLEVPQSPAQQGASNIASDVFNQNDSDGDGLLSADELGIDEDTFNSMDSDGDGKITQSELEDSLTSMFNDVQNGDMSQSDFEETLSALGVEAPSTTDGSMPPPPPPGQQGASNIASDIFSKNDSNGDGSLSADELGIDSTLFNTLDSDGDGSITQSELEESLTSMFNDVQNGDTDPSDFAQTMDALGVEAPTASAGAMPPPPGGAASGSSSFSSSDDASYDPADTNQDGTVSATEYAEYYGSASEDDMNKYTLDLVSSLLQGIKDESGSDNTNDIDLSKFKDIMKMVNNQIQNPSTASDLNTYVSNLDLSLQSA